MGQAQTIPTNIRSVQRDPHFEPTESGVRITGGLVHDIEEKIQNAYNKGKEEASANFRSTFAEAAAQAYENLETKLNLIQEESLKTSTTLVRSFSNLKISSVSY
jgi:flagellar biosynthesis/type III secretory pathway protein FliH